MRPLAGCARLRALQIERDPCASHLDADESFEGVAPGLLVAFVPYECDHPEDSDVEPVYAELADGPESDFDGRIRLREPSSLVPLAAGDIVRARADEHGRLVVCEVLELADAGFVAYRIPADGYLAAHAQFAALSRAGAALVRPFYDILVVSAGAGVPVSADGRQVGPWQMPPTWSVLCVFADAQQRREGIDSATPNCVLDAIVGHEDATCDPDATSNVLRADADGEVAREHDPQQAPRPRGV